jgi:PAS domain S-box-containing protein
MHPLDLERRFGPAMKSKLLRLENIFRSIFEHAPVGIFQSSVAGRLINANPRLAKMFGYDTPEEMIAAGKDIAGCFYANPAERGRLIRKVLALGENQYHKQDVVFNRRDGSQMIGSIQKRAVRNPDGTVSFVEGFIEDITKRKEAEAALQTSEQRFRLFMDNSPAFAWIKDKQGKYVYLNKTYEQRFGVRLRDWHGKTDYEVWPAKVAKVFRKNDLAVLAKGRSAEMIEQGVYSDGSQFVGLVVKFPIRDNAGNQYVGGIGLDITEYQKAQEALQVSERRLLLALDASNAGTWSWDVASNTSTWDDRYHRLYGFKPREKRTFNAWISRVHIEDRKRLLKRIEVVTKASGEDEWNEEFRAVIPGVGERWMFGLGRVERDEKGRAKRMIGLNLDITNRKHAEAELAKSKAELQTANHQLLTINAKLVMLSEELQEYNANLEQRVLERTNQLRKLAIELTESEERERIRIANLLHDELQQILTGAKLRIGAMSHRKDCQFIRKDLRRIEQIISSGSALARGLSHELDPKILHDFGLLAALDWLTRWMKENHGLTVRIKPHPAVDRVGEKMKLFLFQSVRELLFNVVKHAGVKQARLIMRHTGGNRLEIIVSDRGKGFNVPNGKSSRPPTTGSGFFSIRERLELMGGYLELKSAPGRGSQICLHVLIPKRRDATAPIRDSQLWAVQRKHRK